MSCIFFGNIVVKNQYFLDYYIITYHWYTNCVAMLTKIEYMANGYCLSSHLS